MAKKKAYFGLEWWICIILAIIPLVGWVCSLVTRIDRQNWLGAILSFFLFYPFIMIIDIVTLILHKDVTILA